MSSFVTSSILQPCWWWLDLPLYRRWPDCVPCAGRLGGQDWPRLLRQAILSQTPAACCFSWGAGHSLRKIVSTWLASCTCWSAATSIRVQPCCKSFVFFFSASATSSPGGIFLHALTYALPDGVAFTSQVHALAPMVCSACAVLSSGTGLGDGPSMRSLSLSAWALSGPPAWTVSTSRPATTSPKGSDGHELLQVSPDGASTERNHHEDL